MKTATRPEELEILGHTLQGSLQSTLSQVAPIQVRCLLKEGILMILVQHPTDVELNPEQAFSVLERTILEKYRAVSHQVQMYLRVAGQKRAYAFHTFTVEPLMASTATDSQTDTQLEGELDVPSIPESLTGDNSVADRFSQSPQASTRKKALPHPWDRSLPGSESQTNDLPDETPTKAHSKASLLPLIVAGAGLGIFVFSTSLYLLTRPCVIGSCSALSTARELNWRSEKTFENPQSGKEVLEAQEQLSEAIRILESIPGWSRYHGEAQSLLQVYHTREKRVEDMVAALQTAVRAAYKSENPPHPASRWIEVQNMWREAIAQLEQLPADSKLQPLAEQKIKEYKANLAQTNLRLVREREAQQRLNEAKDAVLIARARQGVAVTLPHWRLVYATWQTAMNRFKQIPQGTTAHEEAKQLSAQYLRDMAVARDRQNQEQFAANAYNQALRLAQRAKTSQAENQWSLAFVHWRSALNYANQVPSDTFYYPKAKSLLPSYTGALRQAKGNLYVAVKVQQARSDLNQTCYGKTKICSYSINQNVIKVRLTPLYLQLVKQAATQAQVSRDSNVQAGVVNHILTLGEALEAISDNAGIPVEVYNPEGTLIERHMPN